MKDEPNDYLINYCIKEMVYTSLLNMFKVNGIEGTEERILKDDNEKRKELLLTGYKELVFRKEN